MTKQTLEAFLESIGEKFFINEDSDRNAYLKLTKRERREIGAQATIHEFVSVMNQAETAPGAMAEMMKLVEDTQFKSANSFNDVYFKQVHASGGDITKTPNYANSQVLIKYSLGVASNSNEPASKAYVEKMTVLGDAVSNMVKYRDQFVDAIKREATEIKEDSKRILTQYYINLVMQIDVGVDVLYSSSIKANIDHTTKPAHVTNVYFQVNRDVLNDTLVNLHYFNSLAFTGKLRSVLAKGSTQELLNVKTRLMNENVLDVAFALLTTSDWLDLFLLPLYALRFCVYTVKYLMATYHNMAFSMDRSVAMIRAASVSEQEFASYKEDASRKALMVDQATHKASVDVAREVADNKQSFKSLTADQTAANNSVIM